MPVVSEMKGDTHMTPTPQDENLPKHQDNTKTPLLEEDLQLHSSTSNYAELELNGSKNPYTFADTISEPEFQLNLDAGDAIIQPNIEVTVFDDGIDVDVDLNVNGAAWGESAASTSATQTGQGSDAAYEEFLLRYSPFVALKRLTPQEIEAAAAGNLNILNIAIPALGRQLLLAARNQDDEDDELELNGETVASLLSRDGTGSRFLDDCYEVNLNEEGHIVFNPNNIDPQNVDPPLGETFIVCTLCYFVADSKISLKNHMKIHSKALMCSHVDCFASFDFRPSLQRHYGVYHSPLKPFRCSYDDCYKAYQSLQALKIHLMDHTGERPFRCTHNNCPSEFKTEHALFLHTSRAHSNELPFKCPRKGCSKAFSIESFLNAHLKKHTANGIRRCPNPRCRKLFRASHALIIHLKFCKNIGPETGNKSTTSKRFPCSHDGCHKVYTNPYTLKLHFMDHSGERPFPCTRENCTKAFKTKIELAHHASAKHSDELPVKCPRKGCSKGFHSAGLDYVSHLSGCSNKNLQETTRS